MKCVCIVIDTEKLTGLRIQWSQVKVNMVQVFPMGPAQLLVTVFLTELANVHFHTYLNPCQ